MAGAVLDRQLTGPRHGRVAFGLAADSDDAEDRRLLREHPTSGCIALSFEREPSYFADAHLPGQTKQTIVAREMGRVICTGSCVIRQRNVNGHAQAVGYLGGLRLNTADAGRFDIVRRGYGFFRELQAEAPADLYFTSVAADNERARRFLERGLPGMPRYEFVGDFVTVLLSAMRRAVRKLGPQCTPPERPDLISHLNNFNRNYQLSPIWSKDEMQALTNVGLRDQDFVAVRRGDELIGSAALWDQRSYKQTVVRGYTPWLRLARRAVNCARGVLGSPRLPALGALLPAASVSHMTASPEEPEALVLMIHRILGLAHNRGIELLTLGFAANDPRLVTVRKHFRYREYLTRLYIVRWPCIGSSARELDLRVLAPEIALL